MPDEISNLLMQSGRVPSYKQLAICLLKNDLRLIGAGFEYGDIQLIRNLKNMRTEKKQLELF